MLLPRTRSFLACWATMGLMAIGSVAALRAADPRPVGWRGDGSGQYPTATPPTTWGPDKNIVWATTMPSWSNSSPIVVGGKVFVCSEPSTLVCCNAADGKILWQNENKLDDCATPEEKARMENAATQFEPLKKQRDEAGKEWQAANKALEANKQDASLKAKLDEVGKRCGELDKKLNPLLPWLPKQAGLGYQTAGYSTPTPVSDGTFVYFHSATRIVACYDLDGNRKWSHVTEQVADTHRGHSTTPLLIGDRLFVHVRDLVAYDAKTGKELWRTPAEWGWGSLTTTKIGDTDVVITPKGGIVTAADGKALTGPPWPGAGIPTPAVCNGLMYLVRDNGFAVKVPAKTDAPFKLDRAFALASKLGGAASPVILDGLVYTTAPSEANKKPITMLQVFDAATGALVYEKDLAFAPAKEAYPYPSLSAAGKYIFASCESGETVVFEPGKEYKEVARNTLGDGLRSCLFFQGNRLYIRGMKKLYCIGQ